MASIVKLESEPIRNEEELEDNQVCVKVEAALEEAEFAAAVADPQLPTTTTTFPLDCAKMSQFGYLEIGVAQSYSVSRVPGQIKWNLLVNSPRVFMLGSQMWIVHPAAMYPAPGPSNSRKHSFFFNRDTTAVLFNHAESNFTFSETGFSEMYKLHMNDPFACQTLRNRLQQLGIHV